MTLLPLPILHVIYPLCMYLNNVDFQVTSMQPPYYYINPYQRYFSTSHCPFQEHVFERKQRVNVAGRWARPEAITPNTGTSGEVSGISLT